MHVCIIYVYDGGDGMHSHLLKWHRQRYRAATLFFGYGGCPCTYMRTIHTAWRGMAVYIP